MMIVFALFLVVLLAGLALGGWFLHHLRWQSIELNQRVIGLEQGLALRHRLREVESAGAMGRFSPPARTLMNDWVLPNLRGGTVRLSALRGERIGVVFVQPECPGSRQVIAALAAAGSARSASGVRLLVVSTGDHAENAPLLAALPADLPLLLQEGIDLARVWRVPVTPSAHLIDRDGLSESALLQGSAAILAALGVADMAAQTRPEPEPDPTAMVKRRIPPPAPLPVGSRAPVLAIPRHPVGEIAWGTGSDTRTLLVFMDSACLACRNLVDALTRRRSSLPIGLQIAIVIRGSAGANQELLAVIADRFPVALPPNGEIARAFGVTLTPSAVVIEPDGALSSSGVTGVDATMALVRRTIRETRPRAAVRA